MIIVNTDFISGKTLETISLVFGSASCGAIVHRNLSSPDKEADKAHAGAVQEMAAKAEKRGADAVVNVRFLSSSDKNTWTTVTAFGTAVKFV